MTGAIRAGGLADLALVARGRRPLLIAARESGSPGRRPHVQLELAPPGPPTSQPPRSTPADPVAPVPEPPPPSRPDPSAATRERLLSLLGDVTAASAYRYGLTDDVGARLDGLEDGDGGYLGISHTLVGSSFTPRLATSPDLLRWTHRVNLDTSAAQGTLGRLPDGSWLASYEKAAGAQVRIRFRHYPTLADLLAGSFDRELTAPLTLAPTAEGTPDIQAIKLDPDLDHSEIRVGMHYYRDAQVDRQAVGVLTDFVSWRTERAPALDALFEAIPARGNVGDRDALPFAEFDFVVHEAQLEAGDWSAWRTYLRDPNAGRIDPLPMRTHGGSGSFGNPSVSAVTAPNGAPALVVTQFLFHEGAAPGEAGELLYVVPLERPDSSEPGRVK